MCNDNGDAKLLSSIWLCIPSLSMLAVGLPIFWQNTWRLAELVVSQKHYSIFDQQRASTRKYCITHRQYSLTNQQSNSRAQGRLPRGPGWGHISFGVFMVIDSTCQDLTCSPTCEKQQKDAERDTMLKSGRVLA